MNSLKHKGSYLKIFLLILFVSPSTLCSASNTITIAAFSTKSLSSENFYNQMAETIESKLKNKMNVKLLIRGELGSDESHFYALRRGRIQIAGVGLQSVATLIPERSYLS